MRIEYLGHSAFALRLAGGRVVVIDPFLTENPRASAKPDDFLESDLILLTHDHPDHLGDSFEMCKKSGATLVAIFETAMRAQAEGIDVEPMGIGGGIDLDGMRVNMVNAQHSCGEGHAAGYVLETEGRSLYFAGDTGLFGDMRLIGELWDLDLAALPVGDRFTMGPDHAARAVDLLRPENVIPCHYATFPVLLPDASRFAELAGDRARIHALAPGEFLDL